MFIKSDMAQDSTVQADDVYFAFPYVQGQLVRGVSLEVH